MFARLAFATAINVDPEILIVDEVLAVGDAKFQIKCINKMEEFKASGKTVLFVSHTLEQIKRFCSKAVWIDHGEMRMFDEVTHVIDMYESEMLKESMEQKAIEKGNPEAPVMEMDAHLGKIAQQVLRFSKGRKHVNIFHQIRDVYVKIIPGKLMTFFCKVNVFLIPFIFRVKFQFRNFIPILCILKTWFEPYRLRLKADVGTQIRSK